MQNKKGTKFVQKKMKKIHSKPRAREGRVYHRSVKFKTIS
jgi:hypothetical protein